MNLSGIAAFLPNRPREYQLAVDLFLLVQKC
jgi:hypothetical protein